MVSNTSIYVKEVIMLVNLLLSEAIRMMLFVVIISIVVPIFFYLKFCKFGVKMIETLNKCAEIDDFPILLLIMQKLKAFNKEQGLQINT